LLGDLRLRRHVVVIQLGGCKASPPSKVESMVMTEAKHHPFVHGKSQENPLPDNAAPRTDGKGDFSNYCVGCHGLDGQNTGVPCMSPPVPLQPAGSLGKPEMYSH
jgi:mono/diheme cytochrome c family protein